MAYSSLVLAVKKHPMFGECQFVWSTRLLQFKRTHDPINYLLCTCDIRTILASQLYLPITYMIHVIYCIFKSCSDFDHRRNTPHLLWNNMFRVPNTIWSHLDNDITITRYRLSLQYLGFYRLSSNVITY